FWFDGRSRSKNEGARQHVFQFTNVSRPSIVGQDPYRIRTERASLVEAELACAADEVISERRNVVASFTKWWQGDGDDLKSIVEVLAERALCNGFLEVFVGCSDEPDIGMDRLGTANPIKGLILQDSQ